MRRPCTIKLFWETLATSAKKWFVNSGGEIRRRGAPGERICPVCEVARLLMPGALWFENANPASWAIGLPGDFTLRVAAASDNRLGVDDKKSHAVRRKLLRLFDLKEPK